MERTGQIRYGTPTPEQRERLEAIATHAESPEARAAADDYHRRAALAAAEDSFSGELRRAIHADPVALPGLVERSGVDWPTLRAFLVGDAGLTSQAIDSLTRELGLHLTAGSA